MLTHISLFSGIGGFDLAAEMAGFKTIACVEIDEWCRDILHKRFPDAKIYSDIKDVQGKDFYHVDVLSGGFPCQPISVAGERKGSSDDRWLWPEFFRIIRESRPSWVIIENSPRLYSIPEFRTIKENLEEEGYEILCFNLSARSVGAPHIRKRAIIVANSVFKRLETDECISDRLSTTHPGNTSLGGDSVNTDSKSDLQTSQETRTVRETEGAWNDTVFEHRGTYTGPCWETYPPRICRMDDGIPPRVDKPRLQALGNAVVPQVVYPIFDAIRQVMLRNGEDI